MRRTIESFILTLALFLAILSRADASVGEETLRLRSYVKVEEAGAVRLSQLVDVPAGYKFPKSFDPSVLDAVTLGSGPALGEQRIYSSKIIAQAIRSNNELTKLKFVIPNQVKVENRGYELAEDLVKNELLDSWKASCTDCQIEMKRLQLPILPADLKNKPWRIEISNQVPKGNFSQRLFVSAENGQESTFWISGQIAIRKLAPVLNRALQFGQRIEKGDYRWEWRDVTFATDGFPDEKSIEGQKMQLTANSGDILFYRMMAREKAVQRGEVVRVQVGEGQWQVSLEAVTEQDGYVGDTVNLRNRQTNRMISGVVVSRGEVVIK